MAEERIWLAGGKFADATLFVGDHALKEGVALRLLREPNNPHDPCAISVWVEADALRAAGIPEPPKSGPPHARHDGTPVYKLGMVPAKDGTAFRLSQLIDGGGVLTATFRRMDGPGRVRVVIAGLPEPTP